MIAYELARAEYARIGIDTELAIEKLKNVPVTMHCWQGDDVNGFDNKDALSGGIQTTGNYPGKARSPEELMADMKKAFSLIPGAKKINVHACYAIFPEGESVGRDALEPKHFEPWVEFANSMDMGIDFNPTFFSHPMVKDNLTLSSPDDEVREYWIRHGQACIRISEYLANATGKPCVVNFWIPDGCKEVPADRYNPRLRYKDSLDKILSIPYDKKKVYVTLESKVFGIGLESYTVGSAEFCLSYSTQRGITPLMDNGHYHPTEVVSDKIPSLLAFNDKIALHVTRGVRWDSDHVVAFDDETKEIAKEIVRCGALDRVFIALDYFDASINRVAAWVIGMRNVKKALLSALLTPNEKLREYQDKADFTHMFALTEECKTLPFGAVWDEFCRRLDAPVGFKWMEEIDDYESSVQSLR